MMNSRVGGGATAVRVGFVGDAGRLPTEALAKAFDVEIAWTAAPDEVEQPPPDAVDAILFSIETIDALAMVQLFERLRSHRPDVPVLLSLRWRGKVFALAEVKAFQALQAKYPRRLGRLTPRELQVLDKVRSGETNREIAVELRMSVSTVSRHIENILHKLHARNRTEAAVTSPDGSPWT